MFTPHKDCSDDTFSYRFLVFLSLITATLSQKSKEESKVFNYKVQFDPTVFLQSLDDAPVDTGEFDINDFINNFASADSSIQPVDQPSESESVKPTLQETTTLPLPTSSSTTQTSTTSTTTSTSTASSTKSTSPVNSVSLSVDSLFKEETELPTSLAATLLRPEANSDQTTKQFFSDEELGVNSVEQSAASVLDYNHYNYNYVNLVPVYPMLYHMRPAYYRWHYVPMPVPVSYHHQYNNVRP